ncbi:hypothetical protein ES703_59724 [subsurface metagenome]
MNVHVRPRSRDRGYRAAGAEPDRSISLNAGTRLEQCPRCVPGTTVGRIIDLGDGPACLLCGYRPVIIVPAPVEIIGPGRSGPYPRRRQWPRGC